MSAFNNSKRTILYINTYIHTNVIIYYINCMKSLRERRQNGMESRRAGLRAERRIYMYRYGVSAKNEIINHWNVYNIYNV